jgi:hypothetical protein
LPALLPDFLGSRLPLACRPPAQRYAGRDDYGAEVRAAAAVLVEERLLLVEDVDVVVGAALVEYDESVLGA